MTAAARIPSSTIGMVFECGLQGADKQICEHLAQHIRRDIKIRSRTLDNKDSLLRDAGRVAAQLLRDGCACVLVVWDLRPAWPDLKLKPCRYNEREALVNCLAQAGVPARAPVHLICIEQELESWMLADDRAISALLSTPAHAYKVAKVKFPDRIAQPKAAMARHFERARGWRYDDKVDAIRVFKAGAIDTSRLRRSASFARFEAKLLAC